MALGYGRQRIPSRHTLRPIKEVNKKEKAEKAK
jgi:hypothetical protein